MKSILIVTLLSLLVVLFLTSRYLLKDLFRQFRKYTVNLFSGHNSMFYCELSVTVMIVVLLAMGAAAVQSAAAAIFSCITTNDIAEFCITYRGVFSFYSSDIQNPSHHILWLFVSPFFKLLSVSVLLLSIRKYFSLFNKLYGKRIYSESDCFYFSLIGAFLLFGADVFLYTQSIQNLNMTSNSLYIVLQNLSVFLFFFSCYWMFSKSSRQLSESLDKYLVMGKFEKDVVSSPWKMMVVTYIISVFLTIPSYLGLQWQPDNKVLLALFALVCVSAFFFTKIFLARSWNYLSAILFNSTLEQSMTETKKVQLNKRWIILLYSLVGIGILAFSVFYPKSMFLFVCILLCTVVLLIVSTSLVYGIIMLVGIIVAKIKGMEHDNNYWIDYTQYIKNTVLSFVPSCKWVCCFVFVAFLLITVFPKRMDCSQIYSNNNCVVDPNGEVLWVDETHDYFFVPITSTEIPKQYIDMLLFQEDRGFWKQNSYLPNKSNWHGFSPSILKRGGSNINCQIVKQLTYYNSQATPRDAQRKVSDQLGSYQLSLMYEPEELLEIYLNISSFNGGRGYRGINASSLFTYGRPVGKINTAEFLYLISTLPRSKYLTDGEHSIAYSRVHEEPELVKSMLLKKAKKWKSEGLITNRAYRALCNDTLGFSNHRYQCPDLPISTRLMFENDFKDNPGRHDCTITLDNEKALMSAYNLLKDKEAFRQGGAELQVATLVVEAQSGKIVGHFSSSEVLDYANEYTFPIGSIGKPAICLGLLQAGVPADFTLYDGVIDKRKTPHNSHGWSNNYVNMETILSKSLNAPFRNIDALGKNPKTIFADVERAYDSMQVITDKAHCKDDIFNYPLGIREMRVHDVAQIYQAIFNLNGGVYVPLSLEQKSDGVKSKRIWDETHVNEVKNALNKTIENEGGTLHRYKNALPKGKTYYGKTGTSSRQRDGWTVLCDGNLIIVCWASYGKQAGNKMNLGQHPLWGASTAGLFAVLVYNELAKTHNF